LLSRWTFRGELDEYAKPAERVNEHRLRDYIEELQHQVAPITLRNRMTYLHEALRVMVSDVEFPLLQRARYRLKARARPVRNKRKQMVPLPDLFRLGLRLISDAESGSVKRIVWRASLYRDGLMILILASRPIRRRNIAAMRLERNLVRRGDSYVLLFNEAQMKNGRPFEQPLGTALTPFVEGYLGYHRPHLLGSSQSDAVWISWRSIPMSDFCVYASIIARTKAAFSFGIPPHLFRHSVVTTLSEELPRKFGLRRLYSTTPTAVRRRSTTIRPETRARCVTGKNMSRCAAATK
jgi:integrase/recombinase XerD